MATKTNLKQLGWMYHAPPSKTITAQVHVPPTSQIPGLGNTPDDFLPNEPPPRRGLIKPTDTPYIMLAKQGGRPNLLQMKDFSNMPKEPPKGYERCEWFYLQDNCLANDDTATKSDEPWQFRLPDYMIHQEYNNSDIIDTSMLTKKRDRCPYAEYKSKSWGDNVAEFRPPGYGVRLEKLKNKPVKFASIHVPESYKPKPENQIANYKEYPAFPQEVPDSDVGMSKLLAHGYAVDWQLKRKQWDELVAKQNQHKIFNHGNCGKCGDELNPKLNVKSKNMKANDLLVANRKPLVQVRN